MLQARVTSRAAAPRVIVLAAAIALHALALLALLVETHSHRVRGAAESSPLLVWLIEPRKLPPPSPSELHPSGPRLPLSLPPRPQVEAPSPAAPPAPGAIDWAAEASRSARDQADADAEHERQARALAPKTSPMFALRPKQREFPWDYASTHRMEPGMGMSTVIHLNDECAIALFLIIPFAGGCALEKQPARGDLFDHMRDPQP